MQRKWAAGESDSEDEVEEQEQQQPQPVAEQSEPRTISPKLDHVSESATDGLMMNIKYSATEGQVRQFLEGANCKIRSIEMITFEGKFAGRAVIRFEDNASLKIFIGLHGSKFNDMDIVTKVYEELPRKGSKFGKDKKSLSKSTSRDSRDYRDSKPQDARRRDDRFVEKDDKYHNRRPVRPTKSNDEKDPIHKTASNGDDEGDSTPKERKRVQLAPRTLPVEDIGKPLAARTADIFGGGKPHDEFAYEEKKKQTTPAQPDKEEAAKAAPEELKVAQLSLADSQPAPPVEKAEAVAPPVAPSAEEEADKDGRGKKSSGKFRGQKSGGGKFDNFNNDKRPNRPSKSVSKSRDDDKADAQEPAEGAEQSNKAEEDGHRDGKAGGRFKKQHSGDKKPSGHKKPAGKREEKEKAEPEPAKEADGFETIKPKSAPKALQPVKQVAAPTKTTPKGSTPAVKNAFSGLVSDSD